MSAYLCDQHTINAIATYAVDHGIVQDPELFADLLTLMNVSALKTRYPGRPWLQSAIAPAESYRFERVEASAAAVEALAIKYDYQACEAADYDLTLCARLVSRIIVHAATLAEAVAKLEQPGGCGAGRITIGKHVRGAGDFNASMDGRVVACAFLHDDGKLAVHDIVRGGSPQTANDPGQAYDLMLAIAKREADIADLQEPGGCGAQRLGIYWTAESRNKKTGPIPVSTTSAETCPAACPLLGNGCYAKGGNVGILWHALTKHGPNASWKHGASMARSIDWKGLCERVAGLAEGTLWRHNQAGDLPHRKQHITFRAFHALVNANRGRRGFTYTHHNVLGQNGVHNRQLIGWANSMGFTINLSANTLAHADELSETGAGPVVVVQALDGPRRDVTPAGRIVRTCPATYAAVTCKQCQWCALPKRSWIVGFPAHGSQKGAADAVARDLEIAYRGL